MLYYDNSLAPFHKILNDSDNPHTFMDIEIGGRLIEEVDIGFFQYGCTYRDTLQLATR